MFNISRPSYLVLAVAAALLAGCQGDSSVPASEVPASSGAMANDPAALANSPYSSAALPPPQPGMAAAPAASPPTAANAAPSEPTDAPEPLVPGPKDELLPIPHPTGIREVGVRFIEYEIQVTRDTVPAGQVTFIVVNAGKTTHWLVVRNDSTFADTGHIQPGETAVLTMDLKPGQYYLVCTIRDEFDHISEGERRPFTVE